MKKEYKNTLSLSYSLAKANFKLRNEGSYLGILWYLLSPLAFFFVILFVQGALLSTRVIPQYPLYLLIGITMINFFSQTIRGAVGIVRNNAAFIKSIVLPREVFVYSLMLQSIFSHAFELAIIAVFFIYFHVSPLGILWYAVVFIFYAIFTMGISFICATLGAYVNDLGNIWLIASQLLLFLTPTFYAVEPGTYLYFGNLLNPLFYFVTAARDVSIYTILPAWWMMCAIGGMTVVSAVAGGLLFKAFKGRFAELV